MTRREKGVWLAIVMAALTMSSALVVAVMALGARPVGAQDSCQTDLGVVTAAVTRVTGTRGTNCSPADTRRFTFTLEYPSVIAASASGTNSGGRAAPVAIRLRPASASDSATPLAHDSGAAADIYQAVSSGSYRINVQSIASGGSFVLTLQAFGQPPATPTPIPQPTPRYQPNSDVRLEPDPRSVTYEENRPYVFRVEGAPEAFPVTVRLDNSNLGLSSGADTSVDCSAGAEAAGVAHLAQVTLHVCAAGTGATIEAVRESDQALMAAYTIYVSGGAPTTQGTVPGPPDSDPGDRIKLGELVRTVCEAGGYSCRVDYIRNAIGVGFAGLLFFGPTAVARGRISPASSGMGIAFMILGLFLAHLMAGVPLEWAAMGLVAICFLGGIMLYMKFRRVGS